MPTERYKPKIFISYAHADEPEKPGDGEFKWLSFVTGFLRPAVKHDAVEIWIDQQMSGGADWEREIASKLRACDVFLLLVSRYSTSSDYVVDTEIGIIRERQAKGEDVHFYPLVLTPTPESGLDVVRDRNLRPRDGKPLSSYSVNDREQRMKDAADEIAKIAREIAARGIGSASQADKQPPLELPMLGAPVSVFISYRQEDSAFIAGRICDRMASRLGPEQVFFDVLDIIQPGEDFANFRSEKVSKCNPLVAIMGKRWLTTVDERNRRRFDEPNDIVCMEIETALKRGIWVIPVLVNGAVMPQPENLPEALKPLAHRQGLEISHASFDSDFERLIGALREVAEAQFGNRTSLEIWLKGQSREVSVAIAVRAALRVLPFLVRTRPGRPGEKAARQLAVLTSAVFLAVALAWAVGRYPARAKELRDAARAAALAADAAANAVSDVERTAARSAGRAAAYAANAAGDDVASDAFAADAARAAAFAAAAGDTDATYVWDEVRDDIAMLRRLGASALADLPLWSRGTPEKVKDAWTGLRNVLQTGKDWEIWIDWYRERLRGGSRGDAFELVVASVPQEVKGEAANAWIREHLR
jgi:hypothetical protein